ncbi:hypothetical protein F5883DRAFT_140383 [Diaporthe sp. PMI_573]|nr:hypothetical protein F5883DRAFT_140383 [Diaporthaceae sp. PMI_573]
MDLPELSDVPTRHPDFCLSISTKLLHTITAILTKDDPDSNNNFIISVGSGSGLLEAHLQKHLISVQGHTSPFTVKGVEVRSSPTAASANKYLANQYALSVRGTWEVSSFIDYADTLMFVYPRDPKLVDSYLKARPPTLRVVLWLGPRADWEVFWGCFRGLEGFGEVDVVEGGVAGVAEFEMVAVVRRR